MKQNIVQWKMKGTPVGDLYITASDSGIVGLSWVKSKMKIVSKLSSKTKAEKMIQRAAQQLKEYFMGQRHRFDLPLVLEGTEFQKKVWQELQRIPFGQTASYQDIAARIQNKKAVRAVGSANGRNHVCIVIPCHRVIAKDGTLGGFSGKLSNKAKLLQIEKSYGRMI